MALFECWRETPSFVMPIDSLPRVSDSVYLQQALSSGGPRYPQPLQSTKYTTVITLCGASEQILPDTGSDG